MHKTNQLVVKLSFLMTDSIFRQETLPHIVSLHPGVQMGTGLILRGVTLRWTSIPCQDGGEGVAILSVASPVLQYPRIKSGRGGSREAPGSQGHWRPFGSCVTLPIPLVKFSFSLHRVIAFYFISLEEREASLQSFLSVCFIVTTKASRNFRTPSTEKGKSRSYQ